MTDFLTQTAMANIWCAPNRDYQSIVQPARLTPNGGAWGTVQVQWSVIKLPDTSSIYHVYQIGQLNPKLLGLFPISPNWTLISDVCNQNNLFVDIYAESGVEMPRTQAWYKVTFENSLIIAVKKQPTININFDNDLLYFRFMTNEFFQTPAALSLGNIIHVEGGVMGTTDQILALQNDYNTYAAKPGAVHAYVNGYRVDAITLVNVTVGSVAEFVYDPSVYRTYSFPIAALESFTSMMDTMDKFLIHYAGNTNTIDYLDDIDFYVLNPQPNNRYIGVYYHKNNPEAVRMVTHQDYSISVPFVQAYLAQQGYTAEGGAFIKLEVRHSGYTRTLSDEANRIKELYKLPDAALQGAMIGVNATLTNWQAATLEASAYCQVMGSSYNNLNLALVESAYGYNAISKILSNTPEQSQTFSSRQVVEVPEGLINNSTAYEYNGYGHLIGYYQNPNQGGLYVCTNANSELVEMVSGFGDIALDELYGASVAVIEPTADYRMYTCPIVGGNPTNVWTDVTGSSQYAVVGSTLTWLVDPTTVYTLVRSNKKFLAYTFSITPTEGPIEFSLTSTQTRGGNAQTTVMQIPMGELVLFLNGRSLIENLDYIVQFPKIVIFNKKYLENPQTQAQQIDVRFTGFCNSDMSRTLSTDVGFVKWGRLSDNNIYNVRDDKVVRIVVDGAYYDRTELQFQEDNAAIVVPDAVNGHPYLIADMVIPMRGFTVHDTYTLRAQSVAIDQAVSGYLTQFAPETDPSTPNAIQHLYPVFSPFLCKIIYDLIAQYLTSPLLETNYGDQDVANIVAPYMYLLEFDPTQVGKQPDSNFVIIHPHNLNTVLTVNAYQYKFLLRVVALYMNGLVNLASFINLST